MNENLQLKLQSWVDGELSGREAGSFGREIADDTEAALLVEELKTVKNALAGYEIAVPETREFYWSKIARQIEREEYVPRPIPKPGWVRWLAPAASFAGLACLLLLAVKPLSAPSFDEISSTGEGMEAVTFHDQSSGMTVVWLADTTRQDQSVNETQEAKPQDPQLQSPEVESEME